MHPLTVGAALLFLAARASAVLWDSKPGYGASSHKEPVGGLAPPDAVEKARQQFFKLYNKAAALAEAAPDIAVYHGHSQSRHHSASHHSQHQPHHSLKQHHGSLYSGSRPTHPPAETDPLAGPPEHVTDTPEVNAARAAFHKQYQELAAAAAAAPDPKGPRQAYHPEPQHHSSHHQHHSSHHQKYHSGPKPTYGPAATDPLSGPVTDTPEVASARAAFEKQFQELASLSATVPHHGYAH